ncbi:MAG: uncharacterized protein KVP18_001119 [Porospora cf. gigantea A]|uniref:uncharacterized protein n=1 Tax=Porospora cf. gigantea A TaxID=2853593 RepID=UPI003559587F|nr:MAG: hypothetical protein KVP18_001119 [Porospora cf. gigantea A]
MDGSHYDVVVCGTGLKECILSGLLSKKGLKVLHVDRNGYYGGETASLTLSNLYEELGEGEKPPVEYGANRHWNVDLIPKFVMACGRLVKILLHTGVTKYLEWQVVEGTYVYAHQKKGWLTSEKYIHKVPATEKEGLTSPLMSLLEKNRFRLFSVFVAHWELLDPTTHRNGSSVFDPEKTPMRSVFDSFGLADTTIEFIGHAVALYPDDSYLRRPCGETLTRIQLYLYSLARYGKSPFIYPVYGLGGLPESFSRLSALHGGVYMLNTPITGFEYDAAGKVTRVLGENGQVASAGKVVCDPSYAEPHRRRRTGEVIRAICILTHPVAETGGRNSCQIILPQNQLNRKDDVYITLVSSSHGVAFEGKYIAIVSTTVETEDPLEELQPGLKLLAPIERMFVKRSVLYDPVDDGQASHVFVSKSYDATSHFESATADVVSMYERITGEQLDLTRINADNINDQENSC